MCVITEELFDEYLDICERVMRDKDSIDFIAMNGLLFGLPRLGKSSFLHRLTNRQPPKFSPSTLTAEKSVQISIKEVRGRKSKVVVTIEASDNTAGTGDVINFPGNCIQFLH